MRRRRRERQIGEQMLSKAGHPAARVDHQRCQPEHVGRRAERPSPLLQQGLDAAHVCNRSVTRGRRADEASRARRAHVRVWRPKQRLAHVVPAHQASRPHLGLARIAFKPADTADTAGARAAGLRAVLSAMLSAVLSAPLARLAQQAIDEKPAEGRLARIAGATEQHDRAVLSAGLRAVLSARRADGGARRGGRGRPIRRPHRRRLGAQRLVLGRRAGRRHAE